VSTRRRVPTQPPNPANSLETDQVAAGLTAFTVVPRAPNFCALRRVSSNFDRAYVSTS
jgi:hypothetical protein